MSPTSKLSTLNQTASQAQPTITVTPASLLHEPTMVLRNRARYERITVIILTAAFFCIIGCYTVLRDLRDSLFVCTVGRDYLQHAQILALFLLIPALFLYSYLVDKLKKHSLFYVYTGLYSVGILALAWGVAHPSIGLLNTTTSFSRLFGWFEYLFIEGYAPFVISVFLAFVNSVITPQEAPKNYSYIVAGSKAGGMLLAAFSWWFLKSGVASGELLHQHMLCVASLLVLLSALLIAYLVYVVPEEYLKGYKASYVLDKEPYTQKQKNKQTLRETFLSGLLLMLRYPYALGIFALIFFWQILSVVLNYHQLTHCIMSTNTSAHLSSMLFLQTFWMHTLGFLGALIGTRVLLVCGGQRRGLMAIPLITGSCMLLYYYYSSGGSLLVESATGALACYIIIRAVNYSVAVSVRELLYIPTTKEMRFKSKAWMDAFGTKMGLGMGSMYNLLIEGTGASFTLWSLVLCGTVIASWLWTAHFLGRRYEEAVARNEVIGAEDVG